MEKKKKNLWFSIITFGLFGQIAWQIENMLFNVYVYNTITNNTLVTALMVALSAVVATVTTLLVGAWADKKGIRKKLICIGYILWGLSTALFGLANITNLETLTNISKPILLASILAIFLDCLMTFFGSSANDVAFNIYITERVDSKSRGKVEGILSTMSPIAGLLVVGLSMILLDKDQVDPIKWMTYYSIIGVIVSAVGILGFFIVPKDLPKETTTDSLITNLIFSFKPSTVKENKLLYVGLLGIIIQGIAFQTFYPYLIIYIQNVLGYTDYTLIMVIIVLGTSVIGAFTGIFVDKLGHINLLYPLLLVSIVGLVLLYFAKSIILVSIAGVLSIGGLLAISTVFLALHRDKIPKTKEGQFQGVRIISAVLIPMLTGPFIGSLLAKSDIFYDDLGVIKEVPSKIMFLVAAGIILLVIIPAILIKKYKNEDQTDIPQEV